MSDATKQELTVFTGGTLDNLHVVVSSLLDVEVEKLLHKNKFVHALDQDGRVIEMSYDMDGEELVVEALTATSFKPDLWVGYFYNGDSPVPVVGLGTPIREVMKGADGRSYDAIVRHEPYEVMKHIDILKEAVHGVYRGFNRDQKDLVKQLELESGCALTRTQAVSLTDALCRYAAQHLMLRELDSSDGLSAEQRSAEEAIEERVRHLTSAVRGIDEVHFFGDPRGETIGLQFDDKGTNSLTGTWKVPVNPMDTTLLMGKSFWNEYEGESPVPGWIILTIDETGNAAFVDVGRVTEVARILSDAAEKVRNLPSTSEIDIVLADLNGNRVGRLVTAPDKPTGPVPEATVRLVLEDTDHMLSAPANHDFLARLLEDASAQVATGEREFPVVMADPLGEIHGVGEFQFADLPTPEKDGAIDMVQALHGDIYMADGIEEGEYRYVIPQGDFQIGYHMEEGDVWLVNAKGDIASGYEDTQSVRENMMRDLNRDERAALTDVVEGRMTFEDLERSLGNEDYLDETPEI